MPTPSNFPRFAYLDPAHLLKAVFRVHLDNKVFEEVSKLSADNQAWVIVDEYRKDLLQRAKTAWINASGKGHDRFPYSVDGVCRIYAWVQSLAPDQYDDWLEKLDFPTEQE